MEARMDLISAVNLSLGYGSLRVGDVKFTLSVPVGHRVALVGPNGSGKTSLLRAVLGECSIQQGTLEILNLKPTGEDAECLWGKIAYVPQRTLLPEYLRLEDFLMLSFDRHRTTLSAFQEKMDELLEMSLLVDEKRFVLGRLSSGQYQRAALIRALLQDRELLLLDEPTNHLDPTGRKDLIHILKAEFTTTHQSAIIASHDLDFVTQVSTWVVAFTKSELVFSGPTQSFDSAVVF